MIKLNNRIIVLVCVFIVMAVLVFSLNYLQSAFLEDFRDRNRKRNRNRRMTINNKLSNSRKKIKEIREILKKSLEKLN